MYESRPHLRDVVVEGRNDAALLRAYVAELDLPHVQVHAVEDRVAIPREVLVAHGLDLRSNRAKVQALAYEAERWSVNEATLTCIVDADFDCFADSRKSRFLLTTDYAAMDVYGLLERPFTKFLSVAAKSGASANEVLGVLKPVWELAFVVRYALQLGHGEQATLGRFEEKCVPRPGEVHVDMARVLEAVNPLPRGARRADLENECDRLLAALPEGPLTAIRGHDIAPLLRAFLGLKNELAKPETVELLMRLAIENGDLHEQPMFRDLGVRLQPAAATGVGSAADVEPSHVTLGARVALWVRRHTAVLVAGIRARIRHWPKN